MKKNQKMKKKRKNLVMFYKMVKLDIKYQIKFLLNKLGDIIQLGHTQKMLHKQIMNY